MVAVTRAGLAHEIPALCEQPLETARDLRAAAAQGVTHTGYTFIMEKFNGDDLKEKLYAPTITTTCG